MKPEIRSEGNFQRWIAATWLVLIAFVCVSCPKGRPFPDSIAAQEIVSRHADSAFDVWFDRESEEDRKALNRFFEATEGAETKADLEQAWAAIPELREDHPNFLEKHIFSKAISDGDWPGSDPPLDQKEVFVNRVRQALIKYLELEG
jgi:hypothetical protein